MKYNKRRTNHGVGNEPELRKPLEPMLCALRRSRSTLEQLEEPTNAGMFPDCWFIRYRLHRLRLRISPCKLTRYSSSCVYWLIGYAFVILATRFIFNSEAIAIHLLKQWLTLITMS